jgi:hypothetical protein
VPKDATGVVRSEILPSGIEREILRLYFDFAAPSVAETISGCLRSVKHANAQAVTKHACTSRRLCDAVRFERSPLFYSCLISKEG